MPPRMPEKFTSAQDNVLSYDPETRTVAAGATLELVTWCDWFEFLSVTTDNMLVSINGSYFFPLAVGLILRPSTGIRRLFIRNPGASSNTVTISKGLGAVDDRRVVIAPTTKLKVDPEPTAYGARFRVVSAVGSVASGLTNIVAAGSNLNGIVVYSAQCLCAADITAIAQLGDGTNYWLEAIDSMAVTLGCQITIPAGVSFSYQTTGGCRILTTYRVL